MLIGQQARAQTVSDLPPRRLSTEVLAAIGVPPAQLSPIQAEPKSTALPVRLLYDGPSLKGDFALTITLMRRNISDRREQFLPISQAILYLSQLSPETDAVITLPKETDGLQIKAILRDENLNLVLETPYPLPILSRSMRILTLTSPDVSVWNPAVTPDFTGVETISGRVTLPRKSTLPHGSQLHVQLLENALAGGLSMQMVAQDSRQAVVQNGEITFTLQRGFWEGRNDPDLAFKAWVSDTMGRKVFVMSKPVSYNGPDIDYSIQLDSLKQGKNTKRGQFLNPDLMAQTLVQGVAEFDPINGIPGQARLKIELKQDRGEYNRNPILSEQTLLLRGMETRIPFNLTTDSTHFDPYAPAPFLSVSLTDSFGRIYYTSGEIRAREGENFVRLYPR